MKLKFSTKATLSVPVQIWFAVGILDFILAVIFIRPLIELQEYAILVYIFQSTASIIVINGVLVALFLIYHLWIRKRSYLVADGLGLMVYDGMFKKRKRIDFDDIETAMELNGVLRIQDKIGDETHIPLSILDLRGIKELRKLVEEKCEGKTIQ